MVPNRVAGDFIRRANHFFISLSLILFLTAAGVADAVGFRQCQLRLRPVATSPIWNDWRPARKYRASWGMWTKNMIGMEK